MMEAKTKDTPNACSGLAEARRHLQRLRDRAKSGSLEMHLIDEAFKALGLSPWKDKIEV